MSDLIERLEAATEDQQYAALVEAVNYAYAQDWLDETTWIKASKFIEAGAFIDAALTLVPEGWGWSVGDIKAHGEIYDKGGQPWAEIWIRGAKPTPFLDGMWRTSGGRCGINTATPAIALCIAALRARQSETPQGSE